MFLSFLFFSVPIAVLTLGLTRLFFARGRKIGRPFQSMTAGNVQASHVGDCSYGLLSGGLYGGGGSAKPVGWHVDAGGY